MADLQRELSRSGIDLALFLQNADLYYLTGTAMDATLAVPAAPGGESPGTGPAPLLFVRRGVGRAREESPWPVIPFRSFREIPAAMGERGLRSPKVLGLELDVLPYATALRIAGYFPGVTLADATPVLRRLRALKSPYEVECIRRAAQMQAGLPEQIRRWLRPGVTELEFSAELERFLRRQGHQGIARMRGLNNEVFVGAVAAGVNALRTSKMDSPCGGPGLGPATPSGAGRHAIQPGEPVLVDLVGTCEGYMSDQTRMAVLGPPPAEVARAHEAMLRVQEVILSHLRPGVAWEVPYQAAMEEAARLGYTETFLGTEGERVKFVGHGIGLELDEYPFLAPGFVEPLEAGMVIAIEPKVSLPGVGVIGIENTFFLGPEGPERLTLPSDELIVI